MQKVLRYRIYIKIDTVVYYASTTVGYTSSIAWHMFQNVYPDIYTYEDAVEICKRYSDQNPKMESVYVDAE